ncbi:MAG: tetratricopeptide repeat protein [Holophagales bacterium]|nr:tetratricopeptide repeat protein [Holophagales bacterium]
MGKHRNAVWVFLFVALSLWAWASTAPPNLDKALAAQYQVVSDRPTDAVAHNDLGNLLLLADRMEEADSAYRRAKELDPSNTDVRFNLALLLHQGGSVEEAQEELLELVEVDPGHAWARYQLGVVTFELGSRKAALEAFAHAFALDPTLTFARNNPHVLDNELATEALLLSSRYRESPSTKIPRRYGDAERIADLMLGPDEESEAAEASEVEPQEGESTEPQGEGREAADSTSFRPRATYEPSEDRGPVADAGYEDQGERPTARRQLTNEDLEEGSARSRPRSGIAGGYYRPPNPAARSGRSAGAGRGAGIAPQGGRQPSRGSEGRSASDGRATTIRSQPPVLQQGPNTGFRSGGSGGGGGSTGSSRGSTARLTFDLLPPPGDHALPEPPEEAVGP